MEKEKVLEIEITKINDEYSLAKVMKLNSKVIKEKEAYCFGYADGSTLEMNSENYRNPNFYCGLSDTIKYYNLYLNSENDCFTVKNCFVENLELFLEKFNENFGILKRWRAEENEEYFYIGSSGIVWSIGECFNDEDNDNYELGNYFKSEAEAQKVIDSKEWKEFWQKVRNGEIGGKNK